jgi:hypothetical protein
MISDELRATVESHIRSYESSPLRDIVERSGESPHVIKFVASRWAASYAAPSRLKISDTPALTWGTGTYVTPVTFPLSSVLYGRVGLVTDYDPTGWRVFDATTVAGQQAYVRWAQVQPVFSELVLTVHSTASNHSLRNRFRRDFAIDCVLFHPDQEAERHTARGSHIWMLVTDWAGNDIERSFSARLSRARFTVLVDEEFDLVDANQLPVQSAGRKIEPSTRRFPSSEGVPVRRARRDPDLGSTIVSHYRAGGYVHVYVEP